MKNICEAFYQNITSLYCLPYNTSNVMLDQYISQLMIFFILLIFLLNSILTLSGETSS